MSLGACLAGSRAIEWVITVLAVWGGGMLLAAGLWIACAPGRTQILNRGDEDPRTKGRT